MAENYFGITCEFSRSAVIEKIEDCIKKKKSGYVIALDGHNFAIAQSQKEHLDLINSAIVTHCDSAWIPNYVNKIHKTHYENFYSADLFFEMIQKKQYRHYFLGSTQRVLDALKNHLCQMDPAIRDMQFVELPFLDVQDFDYKGISGKINADSPDLIWVSLGCPKQEQFMKNMQPYINHGIMFGSGALFNFYCGLKDVPQRAPQWMIRYKLEFVYRIFSEPKKQIARCWLIVKTLPGALRREYKRKRLQ